MESNCLNCKWWVSRLADKGACHQASPRPLADWPETNSTDFCSKFLAKEGEVNSGTTNRHDPPKG